MRNSATIVYPPFVATFHERGPDLRKWGIETSNVRCPLPRGPPVALYIGRGEDPMPEAFLVDTDVTDSLCITSAVNRLHAVFEYGPIKFPPVYPALHIVGMGVVVVWMGVLVVVRVVVVGVVVVTVACV